MIIALRIPSFILASVIAAVTCSFVPTLAQAATPATPALTATPARTWEFSEDGVTFDTQFSAARINVCTRIARDHFAVVTSPENRPINASPWFAFRVTAKTAKTIKIHVSCEGTKLRYIPKISVDGTSWIALPAEAYIHGPAADEGTITLKVGPEPLWVSAQEIISSERLEAWSRTLERLPFVTRNEIGRSELGQPIYKLEINAVPAGMKPNFITVISRQHPPETTGSQALLRFIETLIAETPLARRFREKFAVMLVPLVNPDGVNGGNWRHNARGVDLNRDWGLWENPETRTVRDQFQALRARGPHYFHIDFHSSFVDGFYTQPDDWPSQLPGFTAAWIASITTRLPHNTPKRSTQRKPTITTSHNWAYREFGIPTCTYEVGDNTDRVMLQAIATAAAESLMEQLLAAEATKPTFSSPVKP